MTKRYFYSDLLAAAWMAKHFGMRFKLWKWDDLSFQFIQTGRGGIPESTKLEIHPASLPLLEPRVGDLIYISESKIGTLTRQNGDHLKLFTGDWLIKPDRVYIIRRDGKPFHWPESEEAD